MPKYIDADALIRVLDAKADMAIGTPKEVFLSVAKMVDYFPPVDVVPREEGGAECPTCHGTGRIGTTDWLTKNLSKKQLAEEKAKAIAEHEQHIKAEVAREIFEILEDECLAYPMQDNHPTILVDAREYFELKKKYTEEHYETQ